MAKIRSYDSPQQSVSDRGLSNTGEAQFAGDVGRSEQAAIGAATNLGEVVYKRQAQSEVSGLGASLAKAREDWTQNLNAQVRSGTVSVDKLRDDYQSYMDKVSGDITTPEAQAFFNHQSNKLRGTLMKTAMLGQAKVAGERAESDFSTALNSNAAVVSHNPGLFKDTYSESAAGLDAQVALGAIDYGTAEKLKAHTGNELAKNAISGATERSPSLGKKLLASGEYDAYLTPDTRVSLENHIDAQMRAKQDQYEKLLVLKDKDPWQFLQKTGQASGAKPLALDETAPTAFQDRAEFIHDMNQKHGINLPFMSEHEADHITRQMLAAPPEQAVATMGNIANTVQDEYASKFAMQIFKKEPALSAAMMIAGDAPDDARKVMAGMSLIKNGGEGAGKAIRPPKESEVEKQFDAYVGSAIEDAGTRQAARQAITAHMAKTLFDKGTTDFEDFSNKDFNASAAAVLGPAVKINDSKVMSFRDKRGVFLDSDRLSDLVDGLNDKKVETVQGDVPRTMAGEPINLEKSRGRLALKSVGDGLYYVYRDSKPAWDKNKRPFVLNLKAISNAPVSPGTAATPLTQPGYYGDVAL